MHVPISKESLSPSLLISLFPESHPSPEQLRTALSLLHSTPSGDTATMESAACLVCREGEEQGTLPSLGFSAAGPLPWPGQPWEAEDFHMSLLTALLPSTSSPLQRLQRGILFHVGFKHFLN